METNKRKRYTVVLAPTQAQAKMFEQWFTDARTVWNWALKSQRAALAQGEQAARVEAELQVAHKVQTRDRSTCMDARRSVAERAPNAAKGHLEVATKWQGRVGTKVTYWDAKRAAHARQESANIRTGVGGKVAHDLRKTDPAATRGAGRGATRQGAAARPTDDENRTRTQRGVPRALR